MASIKIGSLLLKTLAKPLATTLKTQAKNSGNFRSSMIGLAQFLHRSEMLMRRRLLGENHPVHVRPLNDTKAVDSGANFISEAFLFTFAATLIVAETTRSKIAEGKRRDMVKETITRHEVMLEQQEVKIQQTIEALKEGMSRERQLEKIIEEIAEIGLRGGWYESSDTWKNREIDARKRLEFETKQVAGSQDEPPEESISKEQEEISSSNYT